MTNYLEFNDEATARERSRELMGTERKPGNPDGDGKPYVTTERHGVVVSEDGSAILEITDDAGLTDAERRALIAERPAKFVRVDDSVERQEG